MYQSDISCDDAKKSQQISKKKGAIFTEKMLESASQLVSAAETLQIAASGIGSVSAFGLDSSAEIAPDINDNYQYEDYDITQILRARLEQEITEPGQLEDDGRIQVLATVDGTRPGQFELQLNDNRRLHQGARVVLIPYNVGYYHWIGILLEFSAENLITRALHIDSLGCNDLEILQNRLDEADYKYQAGVRLRPIILLTQTDGTSCGAYTIENLILALTNQEAPIPRPTAIDIRRRHLNCLASLRSDFYQGARSFYQRQLENHITALNTCVTAGDATSIAFSAVGSRKILDVSHLIEQFSSEPLREQLWQALQPQAAYGENKKLHLDAIRETIKAVARALKAPEHTSADRECLRKLINLLFGTTWTIDTEVTDAQLDRFCIDYEQIKAIANKHKGAKSFFLEQKEIKDKVLEQVKIDEEIVHHTQTQLYNEVDAKSSKDETTEESKKNLTDILLLLRYTSAEAVATLRSSYLPSDKMKIIETGGLTGVKEYFSGNRSEEDFQSLLLCAAVSMHSERLEIVCYLLLMEDSYAYAVIDGDKNGLTIAHLSMLLKDKELLEICNNAVFDWSKRIDNSRDGLNALHLATCVGFTEGVKWLVEKKGKSDSKASFVLPDNKTYSLSLLQMAIAAGQEEEVKFYLDHGDFKDQTQISGFGNILHLAVIFGSNSILQYLLCQPGIAGNVKFLNEEDALGRSPLALAAVQGNSPAMYCLWRTEGTDIDIANTSGYTPLHFAVGAGQLLPARYLVELGADLTKECSYNEPGRSEPLRLNPRALAQYMRDKYRAKKEASSDAAEKAELTRKINIFNKLHTDLIEQRDIQNKSLYVPETLKGITYKNLVFMGGGVKGILQVGAVQELGRVRGFMENIKRVGGTSAGAITAGFLATGCPAKELHAQLASMMPYTQFLDGLALDRFGRGIFTDTLTALDEITELANPINLWRFSRALYQQRGLCSGEELHKSIEDKIAAKTRTGIENCTFGELAQLIKTSPPGKYRHLHMMVTKCLRQGLEVRELSSEDPACANYIISDAIRASASLPFLFEPWSLRKKYPDGVIVTEQEQCIDGGLLANYPIGIFDKAWYKHQGLYRFSGDNNPNSPIFNEETLGFYIKSSEPSTAAVEATAPAAVEKLELLKKIMSFYYHAEEALQKFKDDDRFRTVEMRSLGVGTCAFNIEEGQQARLIEEGARAVKEWHKTLSEMYATRISVQLGAAQAPVVRTGITSGVPSVTFLRENSHSSGSSYLYPFAGNSLTIASVVPPIDTLVKQYCTELISEYTFEDSELYIPPLAVDPQKPSSPLELREIVEHFRRNEKEKKVLLLTGPSGSGKTLFSQQLAKDMAQEYLKGTSDVIPIFIPLPLFYESNSQSNPKAILDAENVLIERTIKRYPFLTSHMEELKQTKRFFLILEAYDEINLPGKVKLFQGYTAVKWQVQVLITCNSSLLIHIDDYKSCFAPYSAEIANLKALQEVNLVNFSPIKIRKYIEKYLEVNRNALIEEMNLTPELAEEQLNITSYENNFRKISGLENLIQNPFLLKITMETLPQLVKKYKQAPTLNYKMTRAGLYEAYIDNWFMRKKHQLIALQREPEEGAFAFYRHFTGVLAKTMHQRKDGGSARVSYNEIITLLKQAVGASDDFAAFVGQEFQLPNKSTGKQRELNTLVRRWGFLSPVGNGQYEFMHPSLFRYFVAEFLGKILLDSVAKTKDTWMDDYFNKKLFTKEVDILEFLAYRASKNEILRQILFGRIEASKDKSKNIKVAAANAITTLNLAGVNFSHMDFRNVCIPYAELTKALCYETRFENADLTGVNFNLAFLDYADFTGAIMRDVRFGEYIIRLLKEGIKSLNICVYSPDGTLLAVGTSKNNNVYIYNIFSRKLCQTLTGSGKSGTASIAFSPNSKFLASGSSNVLSIWKLSNGSIKETFEEHDEEITSVAFSPNGNLLASVSLDGTMRLRQFTDDKWSLCAVWVNPCIIIENKERSLYSVAFSAKQDLLAASSRSRLYMWDTKNPMDLKNIEPLKVEGIRIVSGFKKIIFSPNGELLAAADYGNIYLWDIASRCICTRFAKFEGGEIETLAFSPTGDLLASGSSDNMVRLREVSSGNIKAIIGGQTNDSNRITGAIVDFSPNGEQIVIGDEWRVRVLDVRNQLTPSYSPSHFHVRVSGISFSANQSLLASGDSATGTIYLWDAESGNVVTHLSGYNIGEYVAFSQDGNILATCGKFETPEMWCVDKNNVWKPLGKHEHWLSSKDVKHIAFSPCSSFLASAQNEKVVIWEIKNNELQLFVSLDDHQYLVTAVAFSSTGLLASQDAYNSVFLWEIVADSLYKVKKTILKTSEKINRMGLYYVGRMLAFSPTNPQLLLSGGHGVNGNELFLWDISSKSVTTIFKHSSEINCVAFSSDGKLFASGSGNETYLTNMIWSRSKQVCLWNISQKKCVAVIDWHRSISNIDWRVWNDKNALLGFGDDNGAVCVWQTKITDEGASVEIRLLWCSRPASLSLKKAVAYDVHGLDKDNFEILEDNYAANIPHSQLLSEAKRLGRPPFITKNLIVISVLTTVLWFLPRIIGNPDYRFISWWILVFAFNISFIFLMREVQPITLSNIHDVNNRDMELYCEIRIGLLHEITQAFEVAVVLKYKELNAKDKSALIRVIPNKHKPSMPQWWDNIRYPDQIGVLRYYRIMSYDFLQPKIQNLLVKVIQSTPGINLTEQTQHDINYLTKKFWNEADREQLKKVMKRVKTFKEVVQPDAISPLSVQRPIRYFNKLSTTSRSGDENDYVIVEPNPSAHTRAGLRQRMTRAIKSIF